MALFLSSINLTMLQLIYGNFWRSVQYFKTKKKSPVMDEYHLTNQQQ